LRARKVGLHGARVPQSISLDIWQSLGELKKAQGVWSISCDISILRTTDRTSRLCDR